MRYIWPLDTDTVAESLARTSKLAVVYESVEFGGWGAEVAAWAAQHRFDDLDAPIVRLGSERSPVPVQQHLEDEVVPTTERIASTLRELAGY
jgi:pyruvate dehydrogenase E1 component beta subunit